MIGIMASFVPAWAMVQPPPPGDPDEVATLLTGPSKVAVAVAAVFTTQEPVPVQPAPFQPVKVDPPSAVAVRVTAMLLKKLALQIAPQSIPVGAEITFPVPVPPLRMVTVKVPWGGSTLNVAVTVVVLATWQIPVPVHPPLHPAKSDPALGEGVNVTVVPPGYVPVQSPPQLMSTGVDVTVPAPVPFLLIVTVIGGGITLKVAVTGAVADTTQEPAPAQPPPFQPVKTEPGSVVAVNVTLVPPG
jgi:hypothetical protein